MGFAVGDDEFGLTDWYRNGTATAYVAIEARNLAPKPRSLSHEQTVVAPCPFKPPLAVEWQLTSLPEATGANCGRADRECGTLAGNAAIGGVVR